MHGLIAKYFEIFHIANFRDDETEWKALSSLRRSKLYSKKTILVSVNPQFTEIINN